jgi:hypothetical protein
MPFARKVCSGLLVPLLISDFRAFLIFAARVQPEQVPQKPEEEEYEIGDQVLARYSANGAWYTARIISRVMGSTGTYEVAWNDGDPHDTIKHKSNIRKQEEPQLAPAEATVNARVQAWVNKCSGGLLRVEVSGSAGRCIVASRRIEAGAILTQDVPYAMFPIQADACTWCMRPAASESCKACGTFFCGPACLEAASSVHTCECPAFCALESVLDRLSRVNSRQQALLALRILALRVVEGTPADDKLHWSDMETCVSHAEKVPVLSASLDANMKSDSVLLFNLLPGNMTTGITASVVMQLLLRLKYNATSLVELDYFQPVVGLFGIPVAALVNHSCQPNAFFNFEPGDRTRKVVVRATQDIKEGGEICMPYVDVIEPRVVRRQKLFFHYLFDCACETCALSGADDACKVLSSDSLKCAMVCTSCSAMLVLPAPFVQGGKVAPTNKMSKVLCSSCGGEHFVHELEESAESARKLLHEAVVGASGESDTRARVLGFLQKRETMRLHALHHLVYRAHSVLARGAPSGSVAPARELADHPRAMLHILLSWALGSCSLPLDTDSLLEVAQEHMTPYVGRHLLTLGKLLVVACEEGKAGVPHSQVENAGDKLQEAEKVLRCAVRGLAVCHGKEVSSYIFEAASQVSPCE